MRRLEYTRKIRSVPCRARNGAEAAMYLAHVTRERHRLQQERTSLEKRIRRIERQLTLIADAEGKLVPVLQSVTPAVGVPQPLPVARAARPAAAASGVMEMTLQY
jgi:hypothetical protein